MPNLRIRSRATTSPALIASARPAHWAALIGLAVGFFAHATALAVSPAPLPPGKPQLERLVRLIEQDQKAAGPRRLATVPLDRTMLAKMTTELQLFAGDEIEGVDTRLPGTPGPSETADGRLHLEVRTDGAIEDLAAALEALGATTLAANARFGVAEIALDRESLLQAVALPSIRSIAGIPPPGHDAGSVQAEGDATMRGPQARAFGASGAGVNVGIISDSINAVAPGVAGSILLGDLPLIVTGIAGQGDDEGRAMAEIVYDTAPGLFSVVFLPASTPLTKAQAIANLVGLGVEIIADDIFLLQEPFFQDWVVSTAVDDAVLSDVVYVASAGNRGRASYEAVLRPNGSGFHDFDPGAGVDLAQTVASVPPNGSVRVVLQWDEPWGATSTDLDAALVRADNIAQTLAVSADNNIASGKPIEQLTWGNTTGSPISVALEVQRFSGTRAPFFKYIIDPHAVADIEYPSASDTINPDAASARFSIAVAASDRSQPLPNVRSYSSRGWKTRLFNENGVRLSSPEVRLKPTITGPDCVSTSHTFTGGQQFGGAGSFCGTSAATPAVAGVVALIRSAYPGLSAEAVAGFLVSSALDISTPGIDQDSGFGFVDAESSVFSALPRTGLSFFTLPPCRMVDTRYADAQLNGPGLASGEERIFYSVGECGVPPWARGLTGNLTVVAPPSGGFASAFPADQPFPGTSSINFRAGQIRANNLMLPIAIDGFGSFKVKNGSGGTLDIIVDINGYFT